MDDMTRLTCAAVCGAAALALGVGTRDQAVAQAPASGASTFARASADNLTLTAVEGVKVGHFTLAERPDRVHGRCWLKDGTTGGVDVRGGAPGHA